MKDMNTPKEEIISRFVAERDDALWRAGIASNTNHPSAAHCRKDDAEKLQRWIDWLTSVEG